MLTVADVGPLELLIIQPTPFCNIDCSYCYLPDRQNTRKITPETLDRIFEYVFASGLVREPFTLLWHAGEPLVMPVAFYEQATESLARHNTQNVPVKQSFQTNGTLVNAEWCEFVKKHDVHVGVSIDGPAFLHDRHRLTRQGKGTHERVVRGIRCLQENQVPFDVISVLTADSLAYPDELFDFFQEMGITQVGFNTEEVEGPNIHSSLLGSATRERFTRFFYRFMELALAAESPLVVREFETSVDAIRAIRQVDPNTRTQENKPFGIFSADCEGNFSTYSPELLGLDSQRYGSFGLGNVWRDRLEDVLNSPHFQKMEQEIVQGINMCREQCKYFNLCLGSAPGNKYFENGSFASTETLFCRLHKQACIDVALDWLEYQKEMAPFMTATEEPANPSSLAEQTTT